MLRGRIRVFSLGILACLAYVCAVSPTPSSADLLPEPTASIVPSLDISKCPGQVESIFDIVTVLMLLLGYTLRSIKQNSTGLTAQLSLADAACNAFGRDILELTIQVTYETNTRYASERRWSHCFNGFCSYFV